MKLLDLQIGKYLELGEKGFFYGGKTITCPPTKSFDIQNVGDMILHIYADTEKDYDIKCLDDSLCPLFEITLKSNNQKLIGREVGHIDMRFNRVIKQTEPPLELKEICEKTGAVVYGGRYVLLVSNDDWFYANKLCKLGDIIQFKCAMQSRFVRVVTKNGIDFDINKFAVSPTEYCLGNIFEEYSNQLRNEPNKFDELKQYFK